jgi:NADH dehydrogenase
VLLPAPGALLSAGPAAVETVLHLGLAAALGGVLGALVQQTGGSVAANLSRGLVLGLLWWLLAALTLEPLLGGRGPTWDTEEAAAALPALIGDLLLGGLAGLLLALLGTPSPPASPAGPVVLTRVLVLGGGFGGVAAARRLERLFARDPSVEISLVSAGNSLLFTPMLAEVASSALEAQHISAPLRALCPRTRLYRDTAVDVDLGARLVRLAGGRTLPYDHLVLALGAVPSYAGLAGLEEHAFSLKSLADAIALRNHVIEQLERADAEPNEDERRRLLTFVVAGGGFAGTETIAELFDLCHVVLRYYPRVEPEELRFVLVHSRDHILPELGPQLRAYALERLRRRGIAFLLERRVARATPDAIVLADGQEIPTRTVVWTAGNRPHPLPAELELPVSRAGAVLVDSTLRVEGRDDVWAVGDCARIPVPDGPDEWYPPTAQHALREGRAAADNVAAVLAGKPPQPFRFTAIGSLVALGHRTAVAEIRGRRFSGPLAWLLWRGVYWSKLPGLEKKLRVLLDWTIDLVFPRDIVLTSPAREPIRAEPVRDA